GRGIVGDEEETREVMPRRGPKVGEQIGEERDDRHDRGEDEREPRPWPGCRQRRRRRSTQRERSSHGASRKRASVPKNKALATTNTAGSAVWAARKPGWLKAGPSGQRATTLKSSSRRPIAIVEGSGQPRPAIAMKPDQMTGRRRTRWCGQVTDDASGKRGRKAAARSIAGWRRVRTTQRTTKATIRVGATR